MHSFLLAHCGGANVLLHWKMQQSAIHIGWGKMITLKLRGRFFFNYFLQLNFSKVIRLIVSALIWSIYIFFIIRQFKLPPFLNSTWESIMSSSLFKKNNNKKQQMLTRCWVISTAMGVTSSLYSQIIFCMTLVRSSFSVSLTICSIACITGRMKGVMCSLAEGRKTKYTRGQGGLNYSQIIYKSCRNGICDHLCPGCWREPAGQWQPPPLLASHYHWSDRGGSAPEHFGGSGHFWTSPHRNIVSPSRPTMRFSR